MPSDGKRASPSDSFGGAGRAAGFKIVDLGFEKLDGEPQLHEFGACHDSECHSPMGYSTFRGTTARCAGGCPAPQGPSKVAYSIQTIPVARVKTMTGIAALRYSQNEVCIPSRLAFSTTMKFATDPRTVRLPANVLLMVRANQAVCCDAYCIACITSSKSRTAVSIHDLCLVRHVRANGAEELLAAPEGCKVVKKNVGG